MLRVTLLGTAASRLGLEVCQTGSTSLTAGGPRRFPLRSSARRTSVYGLQARMRVARVHFVACNGQHRPHLFHSSTIGTIAAADGEACTTGTYSSYASAASCAPCSTCSATDTLDWVSRSTSPSLRPVYAQSTSRPTTLLATSGSSCSTEAQCSCCPPPPSPAPTLWMTSGRTSTPPRPRAALGETARGGCRLWPGRGTRPDLQRERGLSRPRLSLLAHSLLAGWAL